MKNDDQPTQLGKIENRPILIKDYLASYKAVQRQFMAMYGDQFNQLAPMLNIKGQAWDRLLLLHYAKKHRIRATDEEVLEWIGQQDVFSPKGRFDAEIYKNYVTRFLRSSMREFEEEIRQMLTVGKVRDSIASKVNIGEPELKELYRRKHGVKNFALGIVTSKSQLASVAADDKELKERYESLKSGLVEPERVKIRYVEVPKSHSKQEEIFSKSDLSIDALVAQYSLEAKETPFFSKDEAVPGLAKHGVIIASFTTPAGEERGWIDTGASKYKIKVLETRPERTLTFEEARTKVQEAVMNEKARDAAFKKLAVLKEKLNSQNFEEILRSEQIETKPVENWRSGDQLDGIALTDQAKSALEKLKTEEISEPFAVSDVAFIAKVAKEHPFDEAAFSSMKEKFREEVTEQKTRESMTALMDELRNKLVMNFETMRKLFPEEEAA